MTFPVPILTQYVESAIMKVELKVMLHEKRR